MVAKRNNKGQFIKGLHSYPRTEFKKGKTSPRKGIKKPGFINKTSFKPRQNLWETNVREYQSVHRWIKAHAGQPNFCENCKKEEPSLLYHWANKSGKYIKDKSDWVRLCHICHRSLDNKRIGIERAANLIRASHYKKELILIIGNGGSAELATHFSGELIGRFEKKRREPIGALPLVNSGIITAIANDFGYEHIFSRQVEALGKKGGLLICLTTSDVDKGSGHSLNLWKALGIARDKKKMKIIVIGSHKTRRLRKYASCFIQAAGQDTAEIQNDQLIIVHAVCREVERFFINRKEYI